jgi:hypothetical protein
LRRQKEGNRLPRFVLAGLDPAIHAFGRPKQRRGCADQVRARRLQVVSSESKPSYPCRGNFPGQPCCVRGREERGRIWRVAEALEYGIVGINEGIISPKSRWRDRPLRRREGERHRPHLALTGARNTASRSSSKSNASAWAASTGKTGAGASSSRQCQRRLPEQNNCISGQILTDGTHAQLSSCPRKRAPRGGQALRMRPWTPAFAGATEKEGWVPYVWFIPLGGFVLSEASRNR